MGHLQPVEELLDSDAVKYHRPTGTAEIYSAAGDAESILHLMAHQLRQIVQGLGELPTESVGLRTDTMDGPLDPGETVGLGMAELNQAAQTVAAAADHVRAALNSGVVVKNAWNRQVLNKVGSAASSLAARSGIRRITNRPGTCWALGREVKAVKSISATSAREIHRLRLFVEDGVGVLDRRPRIARDGGDRCLDPLVLPHGDRHLRSADLGGVDHGVAVER